MTFKANEWQSLQGGLLEGSDLAVVARGDKIDCMVRGSDGGLWVRSWDGARWVDWLNLGGQMSASPRAVSGADDRIDCFVRGMDNGLWHRALRGDRWQEWVKLEGKLAGAGAAVAHEGVRVDVLARGEDGHLWCRSYDGATWAAWYDLAGGLASDPVAVAAAPLRVDCYVKGTDGAAWTRSYAGRWGDWGSLGGGIAEEPAVVTRGDMKVDLFVRGLGNNRLWHRRSDGARWLDWVDLAGGLASKPAAAFLGERVDVVARGTDNALWRRSFDGQRWTEWESLGGHIVSAPALVATRGGELVCFAIGSDKQLWYRTITELATAAGPAPVKPATGGKGGVIGVIDTGALVGAAVERLNRQSILGLLQQMVQEIDEHCRVFPGKVDEEVGKLRRELTLQIESLRAAIDKYQLSITEINAAIVALKQQYGDFLAKFEVNVGGIVHNHLALALPDIINQVSSRLDVTIQQKIDAAVTQVDVRSLLVQLETLNAKLELLKKSAAELDSGELKQVEVLLRRLLLDIDLSQVLVNMKVEVGGAQFRLDELLAILAGGDKVAQVNFIYKAGDLVGATFVLVDRTEVTFVATRRELPGGELEFVFETGGWKGVPASFALRFKRQTQQLSLCKRQIALDTYDVLFQTNVVFDLGRRPKGFVAVCETTRPVEPVVATGPEQKLPEKEPLIRVCETTDPIATVTASGPEQKLPEQVEPEAPVRLVNGSFEDGPEPGLYLALPAGDTRVTGWTVGGAGVDYIGTQWHPGDKLRRSVDLNHLAPGSIEQTIGTVPGATYKVAWAMAGNPGGAPQKKSMTVSATGGTEASITFDARGKSFTDMGWLEKWYTFTATGASTVLKFTSTTQGAYGPVIDAVNIVRLK